VARSTFITLVRKVHDRPIQQAFGRGEEEGREFGVDSKPFLARYVAENIKMDKADGWNELKSLADSLRRSRL